MTITASGREEPLQLVQTGGPCSRHAVSSADERTFAGSNPANPTEGMRTSASRSAWTPGMSAPIRSRILEAIPSAADDDDDPDILEVGSLMSPASLQVDPATVLLRARVGG